MARETKVGLLAGLAFIVCFAVILANRGQDERFRGLVDRTWLLNEPAYGEPSARGGEVGQVGGRSHSSQPGLREAPSAYLPRDPSRLDHQPSVPYGAMETNDTRQAGGHRYVMPSVGPAVTTAELPRALDQAHGSWPESRYSPTTGAEVGAPLTAAPAATSSMTAQLRPDDFARGGGVDSATMDNRTPPNAIIETKESNPNPALRSKAMTVHKVALGETLSSIVAAHYGSRSQKYVDAVVHANRSVLSNPDVLPSGIELQIPVFNDGSAREATRARASEAPAKKAGSAPATKGTRDEARPIPQRREAKPSPIGVTRWYQVKKNDRFVSIAREQLGDAARWREVYEMNRDKFPDPERIREGVRIKLPANEMVAERGSRR